MPDDKYTFEQARIRLEEIAAEVRKKDTSLEKSLDLLEEGVRLANICTELVDHTDVSATATVPVPEMPAGQPADEPADGEDAAAAVAAPAEEAEVAEDAEGGDGFDEADDEIAESSEADSDE